MTAAVLELDLHGDPVNKIAIAEWTANAKKITTTAIVNDASTGALVNQ